MRNARVTTTVVLPSMLLAIILVIPLLVSVQGAFGAPTTTFTTATDPNIVQPIGIAATPTEVLFTKPYCDSLEGDGRAVYSLNTTTGATTLFATLPPNNFTPGDTDIFCYENYVAISSGLHGFPAGAYITAAPSPGSGVPQNQIYHSAGGGGAAALFTTVTEPGFGADHHVGITFDTVGTFGFRMIVTSNGKVVAIDAANNQQLLATADDFELEAPNVAPLNFGGPFAGWLFVTADTGAANDVILAIPPGGGAPVVFATLTGHPNPEGLNFVPAQVCRGDAYFATGFKAVGDPTDVQHVTSSAILEYDFLRLAPFAGQILVAHEAIDPGSAGLIEAFTNTGVQSTFDSSSGYWMEGSAIATVQSCGCPATFGFWKHHPFPAALFTGGTVNIGGTLYTAADLLTILNTAPQKGNAVLILGHQLIAALANAFAGSQVTPAAAAAIAAAENLLAINNINMLTDFVQASTALGQQLTALADILDNFNSAVGLNCTEGEGLS
jgi:hypothetical protein